MVSRKERFAAYPRDLKLAWGIILPLFAAYSEDLKPNKVPVVSSGYLRVRSLPTRI